jgi:hypothetical protein
MLTSSIISRYFSYQSILACPSIYRFAVLHALTPLISLLEPIREASLEKPYTEWIIILLILAAAVPDVAVTNKRYNISLLANSFPRALIIRDFPVPPSPPINWYS